MKEKRERDLLQRDFRQKMQDLSHLNMYYEEKLYQERRSNMLVLKCKSADVDAQLSRFKKIKRQQLALQQLSYLEEESLLEEKLERNISSKRTITSKANTHLSKVGQNLTNLMRKESITDENLKKTIDLWNKVNNLPRAM